jgi:hypothetical protein
MSEEASTGDHGSFDPETRTGETISGQEFFYRIGQQLVADGLVTESFASDEWAEAAADHFVRTYGASFVDLQMRVDEKSVESENAEAKKEDKDEPVEGEVVDDKEEK